MLLLYTETKPADSSTLAFRFVLRAVGPQLVTHMECFGNDGSHAGYHHGHYNGGDYVTSVNELKDRGEIHGLKVLAPIDERCMYLGCEKPSVNGTYCDDHCVNVIAGYKSKGCPLTKVEAKAAYDFLVRLSYRIRHSEPYLDPVTNHYTRSHYVCGAIGDVRDYLVQVGVDDITELHDFTKEKELP